MRLNWLPVAIVLGLFGCRPCQVEREAAHLAVPSQLVLTSDLDPPIIGGQGVEIPVVLGNRSSDERTAWSYTVAGRGPFLPIRCVFTHAGGFAFDYVDKREGKHWTHVKVGPGESVTLAAIASTEDMYEGTYSLVLHYGPSAYVDAPAQATTPEVAVMSTEPIQVTVTQGIPLPVFEGTCEGVPQRHPTVAPLPSPLLQRGSMVLVDFMPERDMDGLNVWAKGALGLSVSHTAKSEALSIVTEQPNGTSAAIVYPVFITCDVRSAPAHRIFDVIAHLWGSSVDWKYGGSVVTFYER